MNKIISYISYFVSSIIILTACSSGKEESDTTTATATTEQLVQSRDSLMQLVADQDSLLALLDNLSADMDRIKNLENILSASDINSESPDKRRKIRNDMAAIEQALIDRREKIAELEERLNKSNNNNARLRKAINSLKAQIASQEATISDLREQLSKANIQIDQLTHHIDSLTSQVNATEADLNQAVIRNLELSDSINMCFYVIGSKSELKEQKIINTGFLKKTKLNTSELGSDYFTRADKRTLTTLELHSKKAKVLTSQPTESYSIIDGANGQKSLQITNPERFWSTGDYLVIQID